MRFSLNSIALLGAAVLALPALGEQDATTLNNATPYKNVGYFVNWAIYGRDYHPSDVPAQDLTHLLYSFADVFPNGTVRLTDSWSDLEKHYTGDSSNEIGSNAYGCIKQIYMLKQQNRHMKVLLSIGGWTRSANFPRAASTPETRKEFSESVVALVRDLGLDGVDIDWEYPMNSQEAADYVLLLASVRRHLDAYAYWITPGYHYQITIASPAGPVHYGILNLAEMDQYLDAWHLMAYEFAGFFSGSAGHNANLFPSKAKPGATEFSIHRAVTDYVAAGVPAEKIVLGMPLYGRHFKGTNGLGQTFKGIGPGSLAAEPGILFVKDINNDTEYMMFDNEAGSSYWFNEKTRDLITFDNERAVKLKTDYIKDYALGGAMFWDTSMDRRDSESIIGLVANELETLDESTNQLYYPASQYRNLAAGLS